MSWIAVATIFILMLSLITNIFFVWFAYRLTRQIRFYDDELRDIVIIVKNFTNHLNSVHELEMFYGDETLRHLLRHSREIVDTFSSYDLFSESPEEELYDIEAQEETAY